MSVTRLIDLPEVLSKDGAAANRYVVRISDLDGTWYLGIEPSTGGMRYVNIDDFNPSDDAQVRVFSRGNSAEDWRNHLATSGFDKHATFTTVPVASLTPRQLANLERTNPVYEALAKGVPLASAPALLDVPQMECGQRA